MIKKVGDWEKIGHIIANLGKHMEDSRQISLKRFGLKAEAIAKTHISKQDLGWRPLKAATISQKVRKGLSSNILVATSSYFQSITSWHKKDTVYIGVNRTARNKTGQVIANIARVHEYGSGSIPKRPLWRPSFQEVMAWHLKHNDPRIHLAKKLKF